MNFSLDINYMGLGRGYPYNGIYAHHSPNVALLLNSNGTCFYKGIIHNKTSYDIIISANQIVGTATNWFNETFASYTTWYDTNYTILNTIEVKAKASKEIIFSWNYNRRPGGQITIGDNKTIIGNIMFNYPNIFGYINEIVPNYYVRILD